MRGRALALPRRTSPRRLRRHGAHVRRVLRVQGVPVVSQVASWMRDDGPGHRRRLRRGARARAARRHACRAHRAARQQQVRRRTAPRARGGRRAHRRRLHHGDRGACRACRRELGVVAPVMVRVTTGVHAGGHEYIATSHEDQKFGLSLATGAALRGARRVPRRSRALSCSGSTRTSAARSCRSRRSRSPPSGCWACAPRSPPRPASRSPRWTWAAGTRSRTPTRIRGLSPARSRARDRRRRGAGRRGRRRHAGRASRSSLAARSPGPRA